MTPIEQAVLDAADKAVLELNTVTFGQLKEAVVNWRIERIKETGHAKENDLLDARRNAVQSLSKFARNLKQNQDLCLGVWFYIDTGKMVSLDTAVNLSSEVIAEGQRLGIIEKAKV